MILLTSTCFEHVSDDYFFFISLQVFERKTVPARYFIKEKKNDRFDQGLYRFLDPKFKTFSKLFSKTIISFSRLERDLKNTQEQSVFMMLCKCTGQD